MTDAHPASLDLSLWPLSRAPNLKCPRTERLITSIVEWLTPAQKVGQIIQADIASVSPDDVAKYHLGSVLNGETPARWATSRICAMRALPRTPFN